MLRCYRAKHRYDFYRNCILLQKPFCCGYVGPTSQAGGRRISQEVSGQRQRATYVCGRWGSAEAPPGCRPGGRTNTGLGKTERTQRREKRARPPRRRSRRPRRPALRRPRPPRVWGSVRKARRFEKRSHTVKFTTGSPRERPSENTALKTEAQETTFYSKTKHRESLKGKKNNKNNARSRIEQDLVLE